MIKRLKLIRDLIERKNFSELSLEVEGLRTQASTNENIINILNLIDRGNHKGALIEINHFINHNTIPQHRQNTNLLGLKTQIKLLETELSVLIHRKAELSKLITKFRLQHHSTLGMVIGEILHLRKEIALKAIINNNPDVDSEGRKAYDSAKKDHDEYKKSSEYSRKHAYKQLTKEKKKKLQLLYRKASKMCHPDVVKEEMQEQAEAIFSQLNSAYYRNDIHKVKEIHDMLQENINLFAAKWETINVADRLEAIISKLKADIYGMRCEIDEIKNTEAFQTITSIENWDIYFNNIRTKLEKELEQLRKDYERKEESAS